MIFVTTGTQLPFPRLIAAMDDLAPHLTEEIVAQVGPDTAPRTHLDCHASLSPAQFEDHFQRARVIVAHAGIGTILSAQAAERPLILVPRRHALGEHRNDHQLATARQVEQLPGIYVAWQADELAKLLQTELEPASPAQGKTAPQLIARIRDFIDA